ncbi:MAG: shikimate kinase [Bacteroidia bacterium]|nr:shikimate kinase [Bacteroidia bacterium]
MPGSGKSTWGKKLANALQFTFVDLDKFIEQNEQQTIEDIFNIKGEEFFRDLEYKYLLKTIVMKNVVISCGGGTPCYNNNMELINENGISFYLNGKIGLLVDRILNAKKQRPMFLGLEKVKIEKKMEELFLKRIPFFEQALYTYNIPQESMQSFVNKAIKQIILHK